MRFGAILGLTSLAQISYILSRSPSSSLSSAAKFRNECSDALKYAIRLIEEGQTVYWLYMLLWGTQRSATLRNWKNNSTSGHACVLRVPKLFLDQLKSTLDNESSRSPPSTPQSDPKVNIWRESMKSFLNPGFTRDCLRSMCGTSSPERYEK